MLTNISFSSFFHQKPFCLIDFKLNQKKKTLAFLFELASESNFCVFIFKKYFELL